MLLFPLLATLLFLATAVGVLLALLVVVLWVAFRISIRLQRQRQQHAPPTIAFYHPYCAGGGGGERVLWKMIQGLDQIIMLSQSSSQSEVLRVVIYTIDPEAPDYKQTVLSKVADRFDLHISDKLQLDFVHLDAYRHFLDPAPRLSMLVESFGTVRLAYAALSVHRREQKKNLPLPDWWIDTTGAAFTFGVAKLLFGCRVAAYVHYPTISTDMLNMVWERRRHAYNHDVQITGSKWKTTIKMGYYYSFAAAYALTGSLADVVMVNSTWTYNHIRSLWIFARHIRIVFPPCRVDDCVSSSSSQKRSGKAIILSIGQFRPEKDHVLQLEAFTELLKRHSEWREKVELVMIGGSRNQSDKRRLEKLQSLTQEWNIADCVRFEVNQPYSVVQENLGKAAVGIHTMWNEHFGIGIVEMMASGLIVVVHGSGGPKSDIIKDNETGYLATTGREYADAMHKALSLSTEDAAAMGERARLSVQRFADLVFDTSFRQVLVDGNMMLKTFRRGS